MTVFDLLLFFYFNFLSMNIWVMGVRIIKIKIERKMEMQRKIEIERKM